LSKDIFVFIEQRDGNIQNVSYELIGEASSLAEDLGQKVIGMLLGSGVEDEAAALIEYGADEVIVVDHPILKEYMTEPYAKALTDIVLERDPEILLIGATSIGRDLGPRISARLKTGLTADCTSLFIDPETKDLHMTRPAFGGNLMAVIQCRNHRPQMATIRPGVMQPIERDDKRRGNISVVEIDFSSITENVEILEVIKKEKKSSDITKAKYVVSGGRGVGSKENFDKLKELSEVIGGEVAGSRAAVEAGWLETDKQVGQTGKTVRPDLYIACGISGAIQHVAGMENSGLVIGINKNDTAPIFDVADLGIVGDVNTILPPLITAIKKAKKEGMDYVAPSSNKYMGMENILYNVSNGIAYLTINRPKSLNALNRKTILEIGAVVDLLEKDESVAVLIVRGAGGRAFVAGADISLMQDMDEREGEEISTLAQSVFSRLKNLPQIVIGAINGYALGGGNELAMACDIRIASSRAKFGQPEVKLGLIPGFGGTQRLQRLVGQGYSKELIFTGNMISAEEAYRIGLVSKVVAPEALNRVVNDLAMKIMSNGIQAVKMAKKAINEGGCVDLENGMAVENREWTNCFTNDESKEGMSAFVEKRKPKFSDF
jgi:electron transfer flavoprotein alpha subunit